MHFFNIVIYRETSRVQLNIQTAGVTFDQSLWLKAVDIVQSNNMNVVCRLGGFHVIMSFLGSIGRIMAGSGMIEAMQSCYGPIAVSHMVTYKAVARAIRAHYLIYSALSLLLIESLTSNPLGEEGNSDDMLTTDDISNLKELYSDVCKSNVSLHEDILPQCLQKLNQTSSQRKFQLAKDSETFS